MLVAEDYKREREEREGGIGRGRVEGREGGWGIQCEGEALC